VRPLPFPPPSSFHPSLLLPGFIHRRARGGGKMVQRLTYRKRHSYATKSNQTRVVRTPGIDPLLSLIPAFAGGFLICLGVVLICTIGLWFLLAGGRLVYQYTDKRASGPKCPVTGKKIQGVSRLFRSSCLVWRSVM
jgi:hypothetical protein